MNGERYLAPDWETVRLAHDKLLFNRWLVRAGFGAAVPRFGRWQRYPFLVKKRCAAGGEHIHMIHNRSDLARCRTTCPGGEYFRQAWVPGQVEYTAHVLHDGGVRYARTVRFEAGAEPCLRGVQTQSTGSVRMELGEAGCPDPISGILRRLRFRGACCFNYKLVRGQPQIFEMNPRVGGSLQLDINAWLEALLALLPVRRAGTARDRVRAAGS